MESQPQTHLETLSKGIKTPQMYENELQSKFYNKTTLLNTEKKHIPGHIGGCMMLQSFKCMQD